MHHFKYLKTLNIILLLVFVLLSTFSCQLVKEDYLQPAERDWLKKNDTQLEVLFGYEAPPNAYHKDDSNEYIGLLVDFLNEIESIVGVKFRYRNFDTWNELIEYSKTGRNFIVVGIAHTGARANFLSFTDPFIKVPYVIITRKNSKVGSTKDLIGKKVCTVANYAVNDYIERYYPQIKPTGVIDNLEGLRGVSTGDFDAMVVNQMYASYLIDNQGITNLKIAGESGYLNRLSAATSIKDQDLFSIIEKTVDQITPKRQHVLYHKWVGGYSGRFSRTVILAIGVAAAISVSLLLVLWIWSLSLKKQVFKQTLQIQENEKKFRRYIEYSPNGIFVINLKANFLETNASVENITGYSTDELTNMTLTDIIAEKNRKSAKKHLVAVEQFGRDTINISILNKDGSEIHCTISTVKITDNSFLGFITDITILKQVEEKLVRSELFLESIINGIADPIFVKDEQHKWIALNQAFCDMFGFKRNDVIGKTDYNIFDKEQADVLRQQDIQVLSSNQPSCSESSILIGGRTRTISKIKSLFNNPITGKKNIVGTIRDITDQKVAIKELQKMQKLQSVGILAGGIAHDFNNILMGLFGNMSMAKEELDRDHPAFQPLEEAEKSMSRATRLTKQLLTFSKGGVPIKEKVSIGQLAEEVIRFDLSGSKTELVFEQANDLWVIEADGGQVQQVFSNIAINAMQAMPNGGRLYVALENIKVSDLEVSVPGIKEGNYVKAVVRDKGIGIAKNHLDKIFDPYFSSKQTGSGLGLATSYSILNNHGGYIFVSSELGKGSEFTIYLPASKPQKKTDPIDVNKIAIKLTGTPKILIMDDEASVRKIVTRMLEKKGWNVDTAPDGKEAILKYTEALQSGICFDAVIMDLTVPGGMGGKDAIKEILLADPEANVIVSSGYTDGDVMANYQEYGFKNVVAKPYTQDKLISVLTTILKNNDDS